MAFTNQEIRQLFQHNKINNFYGTNKLAINPNT